MPFDLSSLNPTPDITPEPGEEVKEEVKEPETKEELLKFIQDTLVEHDLMESNIPVSHNYWKCLNKYRGLLNK